MASNAASQSIAAGGAISETARRGVLVKRPKPEQERRIDLPTIGLNTVELAAKAGLAGIGFEADGALMLNAKEIKARANALGLFLYGFPKADAT